MASKFAILLPLQTRRRLSGTINVLVTDKETQQNSIITYKAYRDVSYRYNLLGQVDDHGKLLESDPNLLPQHQRKVPAKSPAAADNGAKPNEDLQQEPTVLHAPIRYEPPAIQSDDNVVFTLPDPVEPTLHESFHVEQPTPETPSEPIKERKKPGPKPKNKEI